ncbi:bactoprenol glucosyl transferase [Methylobacterium haplocladii]|uniref:Bactoprenol glucosyl transferase n=2 Tax=Methylobacterium haplocladii TaxID=1176176 RepID=A0A512IW22_9HYPH|nr:bactoprenol glucosyl transferase [Methylobacterium haplocladii]GJD85563.1 putative glycosyltransferase [Methylobacterium haplocladii]GLS61115.1 bactoprenol glucosyl transferase [Methylobacterium haplocladii]
MLSVVMVVQSFDAEIAKDIVRVARAVSSQLRDCEIILVDETSSDSVAGALRDHIDRSEIGNIQMFRLISQVGFEAAAWAGIENSLGDYVAVLNINPEIAQTIPDMLQKISEKYELVFIQNVAPVDQSVFEAALARLFRRTYKVLTGLDLTREGAQSRLMSRRLVNFLLQHPQPVFRYRTLPALAGCSKCTIVYNGHRRPTGESRFVHRARRAWSLLLNSSTAPMRLASGLAVSGAILNLIYSGYVLGVSMYKADVAPGWVTLSLQQSGMFFLFSIGLFIIAEYFIHVLRQRGAGPPYFIVGESNSSLQQVKHRLNIEMASD